MPIVRKRGQLPFYVTETTEYRGVDPATGENAQMPMTVIVEPERWADDPALLTLDKAKWWGPILTTLGDYEALYVSLSPEQRLARVQALGCPSLWHWDTFMEEVVDLEQRVEECRRFLAVAL